MGKIRKRAPGGGRKPDPETGGKTATFTTRITKETRHELDRAAKASGQSLSNEAERRLRASLEKPIATGTNHALGWAVAALADCIEKETGCSWRHDPFTGTALRYAVEMLLTNYAPELIPDPEIPPAIELAAAKMPPDFRERYRKPAGFGHSQAFTLINEIEQARMQLSRVKSTDPAKAVEEWNDKFSEWTLPMVDDMLGAPAETFARIARGLGTEARRER